jgi:Fe-S-cluster containining protein
MTPLEKLQALYDTLPTANCQKKCQRYCGPILMTGFEASRLRDKRGILNIIPAGEAANRIDLPASKVVEETHVGVVNDEAGNMHCPFLEPVLGNCMAYHMRPLVCRLWGVVDHPLMRCPFGCTPERWISHEESRRIQEEAITIHREWEREKNEHRTRYHRNQ